jgi:hypothetical protein
LVSTTRRSSVRATPTARTRSSPWTELAVRKPSARRVGRR